MGALSGRPVAVRAVPARTEQINIKVSADCREAFAAIAQTQGFSKAELFEDLVAARLEDLRSQGVTFKGSGNGSDNDSSKGSGKCGPG